MDLRAPIREERFGASFYSEGFFVTLEVVIRSIATKTSVETQKLAGVIVKNLLKKPHPARAGVVGFSGELGAGKTTLIQGIGKSLGVKEKIQSPTFVLMRTYALRRRKKIPWQNLVHIDAYRLENKKEAATFGLKNIFRNPKNLVLIEWAEKIKSALPRFTLWVELKHSGKTHRHILIKT
ncbi:MAG: tRNA (adenosine(37)-N6)-threonylcarbamoyltransferase complex ATPase subunit type 1 TsaE [Candidatus Sungiibacteriota bacterium]